MNGTRKVKVEIINGNLVVRVGGGYISLSEYIIHYMKKIYKKNRRTPYYNSYDGNSQDKNIRDQLANQEE